MGQRHKVLETDNPTAKFLYTIIKQLDLKSVRFCQHIALVFKNSSNHLKGYRSTGIVLPPILRYQMVMLLACDIPVFDNRWMELQE
jgi:hypothetical protein